MSTLPITWLFGLILLICELPAQARYRVTFQSTWSSQTHPTQFPPNPHFSPLVGATHNGSVTFWQPGGTASPGIQAMAELGVTGALVSEVQTAIANGSARSVLDFTGTALGTSPGQVAVEFDVLQGYSRLTLVSMLAPSPDWFVGVRDVQLIQGGDWVARMVLPALVYDAGTDSGTSYLSPNQATQPPMAIGLVDTMAGPFAVAPIVVGSFTFERLWSTMHYGCNLGAFWLYVSGTPRLGQSVSIAVVPYGSFTGSPTVFALSTVPPAAFPCGVQLPNAGYAPGTPGELLLGPIAVAVAGPLAVPVFPIPFVVPIPNVPGLIGQEFYCQPALIDGPTMRLVTSGAVAFVVGN